MSDSGGATGSGGAGAGAGSGGAVNAGGVAANGGTSSAGAAGAGVADGGIAGGTGSGGADAGSGGSPAGDAGIGDPPKIGCADGQREGFLSLQTYPAIAACGGGFALPGIVDLVAPACAHAAGDDGITPDGTGCNALDLCAVGWHVCNDAAEVVAKSSTGCAGAAVGADLVFFATAQHGPGQGNCGMAGSDDVFGCGTLGAAAHPTCAPLDRWSKDNCDSLASPWACAGSTVNEALNLVKPGAALGGVLCCRS
jgi:hypothetical protein